MSEPDFCDEVIPHVTFASVGTWPELLSGGLWSAQKKALILLKHQTQEQVKALTIKISNMNPVYPAAHSSHATVHPDSKCNFNSPALNF